MIMNIRPGDEASLNTVLEEMESRFNDEKQLEMVNIIGDILGRPDGNTERHVMNEIANEARQEAANRAQEESMEVDR